MMNNFTKYFKIFFFYRLHWYTFVVTIHFEHIE